MRISSASKRFCTPYLRTRSTRRSRRRGGEATIEEAARVLRGGGAVHDLEAAFAAQERIAKAQAILTRRRLGIDDRDTIRLATLQVIVPVRNAQMADPELTSVLALFRRAANVVGSPGRCRGFQGTGAGPRNPGGYAPPPQATRGLADIWQITGALAARGIWRHFHRPARRHPFPVCRPQEQASG